MPPPEVLEPLEESDTLESLDGIELAHHLVDVLADHQAADVVLLDLTTITAFADYFVIASIDNERQMRATVEALAETAKQHSRRVVSEGTAESGWVLVEVDGVIVHLFTLEQRAHYDLESLWHSAREVVRIQ